MVRLKQIKLTVKIIKITEIIVKMPNRNLQFSYQLVFKENPDRLVADRHVFIFLIHFSSTRTKIELRMKA